MALVVPLLRVLGAALANLEAAGCSSRHVLSLGYPDVIATSEQIRAIFGERVASAVAHRVDSAAILQWHGMAASGRVPEASSLLSLLGCELESVDIVAARGNEIIQDLNEPVGQHLFGRYAAVIDAGTLEHCFNVAQAARNIAAMTGVVLHLNPLNMYNHGFYNFSPTWYQDFYETNGFVVERLEIVWNVAQAPSSAPAPAFQRFQGVPETSMLLAVARRREVREIRWPTQKKYRDNPALRG
jgi:hypothetical protein